MSEETVKLDISIRISQRDSEADTGFTVAEWNALTNERRQEIFQGMWQAMASSDDGGARVITPGAEDI